MYDYEEEDLVIFSDDEGNEIKLLPIQYFFYNGDEYAILVDVEADADEEAEDVDCFVTKVVAGTDENGEEIETYEPIEDEALEAKLIEIAQTTLDEEDEEEE
ncbi:MAG: DUF1292 domain-containing protein [Clostridia bacterium]|nr:DUF1292 domain-containing protein [Clostridia bacterium]